MLPVLSNLFCLQSTILNREFTPLPFWEEWKASSRSTGAPVAVTAVPVAVRLATHPGQTLIVMRVLLSPRPVEQLGSRKLPVDPYGQHLAQSQKALGTADTRRMVVRDKESWVQRQHRGESPTARETGWGWICGGHSHIHVHSFLQATLNLIPRLSPASRELAVHLG